MYGVSNGVKRTNYNSISSYSGFSSASVSNIAATHTAGGNNFGGWVSTHYHQIAEINNLRRAGNLLSLQKNTTKLRINGNGYFSGQRGLVARETLFLSVMFKLSY